MRQAFRPEFLNRVDEIIVFHALTEEHLKQIVDIQLGQSAAAAGRAAHHARADGRGRAHLVRVGYDPATEPGRSSALSSAKSRTSSRKRLLRGDVRDGQHVRVDYKATRLTFDGERRRRTGAGLS